MISLHSVDLKENEKTSRGFTSAGLLFYCLASSLITSAGVNRTSRG